MSVRIRLSRAGAKKRPFYRIVIADSRRARDGKFIERIGTYNPMLNKKNPNRVKINLERAKYWLSKGARPSDRIAIFLSNMGVVDKPVITIKTKKHLPRAKKKENKDKPEEKTKGADGDSKTPEKSAKPDVEKKDEKENK